MHQLSKVYLKKYCDIILLLIYKELTQMIDSSKALARGHISDLVDIGANMKIVDMIDTFNNLVRDNVPEDKTYDDFTGGYVQQMANSNQLVLYFGYKQRFDEDKKKMVNTKNKATTILNIDYADIDIMYVGLKAKVTDMRLNKHKKKHKTVSIRDYAKRDTVVQESPKELPMKADSDSIADEHCEHCDDVGCAKCC